MSSIRNLRLLTLSFFAVALIPASLLFWATSHLLEKNIQEAVVNDPAAGLSQSLNILKVSLLRRSDKITSSAARYSENDNFKKFLSAPSPSLAAFKVFGKKMSESTQLPLIIITDKKGNVLFDNLNIPKPTPVPAPLKNTVKSKLAAPLPSLRDFPGMGQALAGSPLNGFFNFQGSLYNGGLTPVSSRGKTLGVIILGVTVNHDFVHLVKTDSSNDLAIYSAAQTWCSFPGPPPSLDYEKLMGVASQRSRAATLDWHHGSYLAGGLPLYGLDSQPLAFLSTFQPIKRTLIVEGNPQKTVSRQGWWFLLTGLLLAAGAAWSFLTPFNRLLTAVERIKNGNLNVDLPLQRPDELGAMARSLDEMITRLKEKDRVSLILGKVVSPQAAKNILEANDLFALKGERREVAILHADLRGFNTLSENMTPQNLVEALNEYFTLINEIVFKHEGLLDKFIGGTAIALWGAPFAHEDKELRAVQTALEIQEALKDFNISRIKKALPPFTLGIGIHRGWVVSGNLGSDKRYDYTVIGEPLHVAARLCAMAAPGQTVASEDVIRELKPPLKTKALSPMAVRGSDEPLKTYEMIGPK